MELDIVYYRVNLDDDGTGLRRTSIVDDPAIGENYELFNKVAVDKFEITSEDKRIITGPVMIPELKMLRKYSNTNKYYYCVFTAEAILNTVKKASKEQKLNEVNLQHLQTEDAIVTCAYMIESIILSDENKPEKYKDLPNGTWIASFWIEDEQYWNDVIKSSDFKGFSVEVAVEMIPEDKMNFSSEDFESELYDKIKAITFSDLSDEMKESIIKSMLNI